jgi:hypothetical protein
VELEKPTPVVEAEVEQPTPVVEVEVEHPTPVVEVDVEPPKDCTSDVEVESKAADARPSSGAPVIGPLPP